MLFANIKEKVNLTGVYIFGFTAVGNIDTSGISMLEEVKKITDRRGLKVFPPTITCNIV